jgi:hypothetical protein
MATYDPLDKPYDLDASQPSKPQSVPNIVLKQKRAINLYFIAVGALAAVVVLIPILSILGRTMPPEIWSGWNVAMGGLIALIGAQSNGNTGGAA